MAARAGFTVTMFIIDISPSMGTTTTVDVQQPDGSIEQIEMTHLERAIQFVKLKIQDLIYYDRKTDQCGVILVGSEETKNVVNDANDGYDHIQEYIPIAKPNSSTLAMLDALRPSTVSGDTVDGLVVALETQQQYLATKAKWTRKVYLVTDGESPLEIEDWEAIVRRMNESSISLVVVGVDFDDEEFEFTEPNKNKIKRVNEKFYHTFVSALDSKGYCGNLEAAIAEVSAPESKLTRSVMFSSTLRIGDTGVDYTSPTGIAPDGSVNEGVPDEAVEIDIRVSKATAFARPKSWKKFAVRQRKLKEGEVRAPKPPPPTKPAAKGTQTQPNKNKNASGSGNGNGDEKDKDNDGKEKEKEKPKPEEIDDIEFYGSGDDKKMAYVQLAKRTRYVVDPNPPSDSEYESDDDYGAGGEGNGASATHETPNGRRIKAEPRDRDTDTDDLAALLRRAEARGKLPPLVVEKEDTVRGFKYGTTYVPEPEGGLRKREGPKGVDVCGFFPAANFRRELCLGEVSYIFANPASEHEQLKLSAIVRAMNRPERPLMAIARYVARDKSGPRMAVLMPCEFEGVDCLLLNIMPFADDVRKYTFASLTRLVSRTGEVLTKHAYMPTEKQLAAMDKFVDAMDMMDVGEKDEDGNRTAWYQPQLAYNPALHRIKQAQYHTAVVQDVVKQPLPPPHPELTRFFQPPKRALKRAREAIEECKEVFNVRQVPKRPKRIRRAAHVHAHDDDEDEYLLPGAGPQRRDNDGDVEMGADTDQPETTAARAEEEGDGIETETDVSDDDEDLLLNAKGKGKAVATPSPRAGSSRQGPLPTPGRSPSPARRRRAHHNNNNNNNNKNNDNDDNDNTNNNDGRAPGRIIGNTHPLRDFQKNLARGDIVSKAVEDLAAVVAEVVGRPFASRRTEEMVECMVALRKTCLEEDEVDAWNDFLTKLKAQCLAKRGNAEFWQEVQQHGTDLTLISKQEAKALGGDSKISENEAIEFVQ